MRFIVIKNEIASALSRLHVYTIAASFSYYITGQSTSIVTAKMRAGAYCMRLRNTGMQHAVSRVPYMLGTGIRTVPCQQFAQ